MIEEVVTDFTTSELAEQILQLQGQQYSLDNYPMFRDIFNSNAKKRLMKSGRQVSKTVTLAADMLTKKVCNPFHKTIYCNASDKQTKSFSTSKLDPFLLHSPTVKEVLLDSPDVISNVYYKRFANASEIKLSYISDTGDRVRGESADELELDEIQDMLIDAIIDVEECLSAAKDPRHLYAGTSKSINNVIEFYWNISTKNEWVIKCEHCNMYNLPDMGNIGKHGIICKKCGKPLDTYKGFWYSTAKEEDANRIQFDGYHIPQIILPMHCLNESKWDALLGKLDTYPDYKFMNEVMGVPSGEGSSLITEEILRSICLDNLNMTLGLTRVNSEGSAYRVAGIDWGGGGRDGTSRTVLMIAAVYPSLSKVVYIYGKIYMSKDFDANVKDIADICRSFDVTWIYGDWGGGIAALSQLSKLVGATRVVPVMYSNASAPYKWDNVNNRAIVNKVDMIDNFILDIKNGMINAVKWDDFKPFANDYLNVYEETTKEGRRFWARYPSMPDDSLHASIYAWLGARTLMGNFTFYGGDYNRQAYSDMTYWES